MYMHMQTTQSYPVALHKVEAEELHRGLVGELGKHSFGFRIWV